jgi:putative heme-binding domain-containing protein
MASLKSLLSLSFAASISVPLVAVEPWADAALPVKEGIVLWLDASRINAVRQARQQPALKPGDPVATWPDASGFGRDARQEQAEAQPRLQSVYPGVAVAFDGTRQALAIDAPGFSWRNATVIVNVLVQRNPGDERTLFSAGAKSAGAGLGLSLGAEAQVRNVPFLTASGPTVRGEGNLLAGFFQLRAPTPLALVFDASERRLRLYRADGSAGDALELAAESIPAEAIVLGGRSVNTGGALMIDRHLPGAITDVLIYDRVLPASERTAVLGYLAQKFSTTVQVATVTPPRANVAGSVPFMAVENAPVIQPLVPGFTARKLPLQLTNLNFLRYRADGRLYAGAYNGKIYLLRDTNGDGLEDQASVYFESKDVNVVMGMALTPPGYPRGEGVFIVSRGKALLLLDKDGDHKAEEVVTVAEGWPPPARAAGGVSDSLAIAVAPDGSVVFGIGTDNFYNAYSLDSVTGQAGYRLDSPRGTIQRVAPDFSRREALVTGIRFPYGLAFNRHGDLFATEQEGATWLANGNPYDELLHIQPGRHYGFPPVHPKHLPGVIDEPSTFDYGPQHQSTVGLAFNEPVADGGASFGPAWWRGDALVSAMSRGKLYRTKLVKTSAGYIARNETIAQLQRIIIDQAVTPSGALTVTLHSGKPDWGTGPTGEGELWQLTPANTLPPQPALAWSANARELRVAFDREIGTEAFAAMQGKVRVVQGRHASAGDRFETMRPGYQVVRNQLATPRFNVPVQKLELSPDRRTLVISTAERTTASTYAISVETDAFRVAGAERYGGQIDVEADLSGLQAEWQSSDGTRLLKTWLPHADFGVSREFASMSAEQQAFFARVAEKGTIALRGQLDLGLMLYPVVQSGSKLDWEYPEEKVTVVLEASRPFRALIGTDNLNAQAPAHGGRFTTQHTLSTRKGTWVPFDVIFGSGEGDPALSATWFTDRSARPRPFAARRFLASYAREQEQPPLPRNEDLPQLAGGDRLRGREVFKAACATCHAMNGEGARVGPDLANLIFRDYDSVLRDIREPSAAINPEHVAYTVTKKDGSELTAVLLSESPQAVSLAEVGGNVIQLPRSQIAALKQLSVSLMPPAMDEGLGAERTRDLLRFLLVPGLEPAPIVLPNPPLPRPRAEFEPALNAMPAPADDAKLKPLRIVLCASEKDPGHLRPGLHDYPLWRERWSKLLGFARAVTVEAADRWPSAEQWARADIVVSFHNNPAWNAAKAADLDAFLARGGGLVFLHYSINAAQDRPLLAQRLGHAWGERGNKFRIGATPLRFLPHEITAGFPTDRAVAFTDETYALMLGDLAGWTVLANSDESSGPAPQMWLRETDGGRAVVCIPGHSTWTHDDPLYRLLVFRAMLWSAREPLGRFNALTTVGARFAP